MPGVRDDSQGGFGQAPIFDRHHDMTLALIAWTEEGITPDMVIGTRYINNTRALGIQYQRPICRESRRCWRPLSGPFDAVDAALEVNADFLASQSLSAEGDLHRRRPKLGR